ncbi:MAG: hypothetical protein OXH79_02060 [Boseongicola sp.]|nr:hypothetical protein [Boseongicola sp.]
MTASRATIAFALLSTFTASEAASADIKIVDSEVTFVEASLYENSLLKRLRNSALYFIAPNALKSVWPSDGYDVETVRNLACADEAVANDRTLGNKLTFVRDFEGIQTGEVLDGVEVDFKRSPASGPRLRDLCQWLQDDANSISRIMLHYDALNPPRGGEWVELKNGWSDISEDATPVLVGKVRSVSRGENAYYSWKMQDDKNGASLNWFAEDVEAIAAGSGGVVAVWRYEPDEQNAHVPNWDYYLTISKAETISAKQDWSSLRSDFTWNRPPALEDDIDVVLWALADSAHRRLDDNWYFVTDEGFPDLDPAQRFEQRLNRGNAIDTDLLLPN